MERGRDLPRRVAEGDVLIGIASNGVHSNGYSLVRKIVERSGLGWGDASPFSHGVKVWGDMAPRSGITLGEALLAPTTLYVKAAVAAMDDLNALAHITGGGLTENLPRVLPEGLGADIELNAWAPLPVFKWLAEQGGLDEAEMLKTFNCGIGMVAVVARDKAQAVGSLIESLGHDVAVIGQITAGEGVRYSGSLL